MSVIVPVHGRPDLARRAVGSVAAQAHRPIELIVVDDASPSAFEMPPEASAAGLSARLLRRDENGGPGASRETGRRAATGAYLAYLDSDDAWRPGHLAGLVAALESDSEAGMAYSRSVELVHGEERGLRRWNEEDHREILPGLLWGRPWHTSACLWRRRLTDAVGPWMPIWSWEDYEHDCRAGCLDASLVPVSEASCLVHADAPGRVSERGDGAARRARSFALAVLSMAAKLRATRFATDARVRERVRELLLAAAAKAADQAETALAARALREAWGWPGPRARLALASGAGLPLLWLSRGRASARFFRWARRPSSPRPAAAAPLPGD